MNLDDHIKPGYFVKQAADKSEIKELLEIVERDLTDAENSTVSLDWQFGIAYNGILKLATILMRASGYRVKGPGHHERTLKMIPNFLGDDKKKMTKYFDDCRKKRNLVEYHTAGDVTNEDVEDIIQALKDFKTQIQAWLKEKMP